MLKAIDVYLERSKTRHYVGRLSQEGKRFVFEYKDSYRFSPKPIAFGPDLPLSKKKKKSSQLFPSFADRIPMKQNPAYKEYCQSVGISPTETNPMVLLSALGRKAPSSFILEPVCKKLYFSGKDLKKFRKSLKLSIRDFSALFEISPSAIHQIESNKTSGQRALKQIEIYATKPQVALDKIQQNGLKINENKKNFAESIIKSQIPVKVVPGPWTVGAKDIEKCSPKQLVELLRRLILSECAHSGIAQRGVHISGNLFSSDAGQDSLIRWTEGFKNTNWFPSQYNCFQIKAQNMSPKQCIKEMINSKGQLKPAIKKVIKNKGAYILCSSYEFSDHALIEREEEMKQKLLSILKTKSLTKKNMPFKTYFYDGNKLSRWTNSYPYVALWFLKEVK